MPAYQSFLESLESNSPDHGKDFSAAKTLLKFTFRGVEKTIDGLFKIQSTDLLDSKLKKKISTKFPEIEKTIGTLESQTGIKYPPYYIEPILTVVESPDNIGGLGVLYARTMPIENQGKVTIIVQLSVPLILYGLKTTIRAVLAHELLHYIDLVGRFTRMDVSTLQASGSMFEEKYADMDRALDPSTVFKDKKLARQISKKINDGLNDNKLDEKCRMKWLEKGLPTVRTSISQNQARISVEAIQQSDFDPKVKEIARGSMAPNLA